MPTTVDPNATTFTADHTIRFRKHGVGTMQGWFCYYSVKNDVFVWVETRKDGYWLVDHRTAHVQGPYDLPMTAAIVEETARATNIARNGRFVVNERA